MAGRDQKGRFTKGHSISKGHRGGSGRPRTERRERFLDIMEESCTEEDWRAIIGTAVTQAKEGDVKARDFLAKYLLLPPPQRHELSGPDGGPIETDILDNRAGILSRLLRLNAAADPGEVGWQPEPEGS